MKIECRPYNIHIYLTASCNMLCRYCWNQQGTFGKKSMVMMTPEVAKRFIAFVNKNLLYKDHPFISFSIFGGEPLLNPEVLVMLIKELEKIRNEKQIDVRILLFSNGLILNDKIVSMMKNKPWAEYHVGFDGPKQNHDQYRIDTARKGTYERVVQNITTLIDSQVLVAAETVITKPYDYISLLGEYQSLGISYAYIQEEIIPVHGEAGTAYQVEAFDLSVWASQYEKFTQYYLDQILQKKAILLDPLFGIVKDFHPDRSDPCIACSAGTSQIAVASDGTIWACNQLQEIESFRLGDVFNGISGQLFNRYERLLRNEGVMIESNAACSKCSIRDFCKGGCYSQNYQKTGRINQIAEKAACEFKKVKFQLDLDFVERMVEHFPTYVQDVAQRNYKGYFPNLY